MTCQSSMRSRPPRGPHGSQGKLDVPHERASSRVAEERCAIAACGPKRVVLAGEKHRVVEGDSARDDVVDALERRADVAEAAPLRPMARKPDDVEVAAARRPSRPRSHDASCVDVDRERDAGAVRAGAADARAAPEACTRRRCTRSESRVVRSTRKAAELLRRPASSAKCSSTRADARAARGRPGARRRRGARGALRERVGVVARDDDARSRRRRRRRRSRPPRRPAGRRPSPRAALPAGPRGATGTRRRPRPRGSRASARDPAPTRRPGGRRAARARRGARTSPASSPEPTRTRWGARPGRSPSLRPGVEQDVEALAPQLHLPVPRDDRRCRAGIPSSARTVRRRPVARVSASIGLAMCASFRAGTSYARSTRSSSRRAPTIEPCARADRPRTKRPLESADLVVGPLERPEDGDACPPPDGDADVEARILVLLAEQSGAALVRGGASRARAAASRDTARHASPAARAERRAGRGVRRAARRAGAREAPRRRARSGGGGAPRRSGRASPDTGSSTRDGRADDQRANAGRCEGRRVAEHPASDELVPQLLERDAEPVEEVLEDVSPGQQRDGRGGVPHAERCHLPRRYPARQCRQRGGPSHDLVARRRPRDPPLAPSACDHAVRLPPPPTRSSPACATRSPGCRARRGRARRLVRLPPVRRPAPGRRTLRRARRRGQSIRRRRRRLERVPPVPGRELRPRHVRPVVPLHGRSGRRRCRDRARPAAREEACSCRRCSASSTTGATSRRRYTEHELRALFAGWDDVRVREDGGRTVTWTVLTGSLLNGLEQRVRAQPAGRVAAARVPRLVRTREHRRPRARARSSRGQAPSALPMNLTLTARKPRQCLIRPRSRSSSRRGAAGTSCPRPRCRPRSSRRTSTLEVIVVDDGSQDETPARLEELGDPRLGVIRHETSRGRRGRAERGHRGGARGAGSASSTTTTSGLRASCARRSTAPRRRERCSRTRRAAASTRLRSFLFAVSAARSGDGDAASFCAGTSSGAGART